jgi:chemotaxis response regulator CheB
MAALLLVSEDEAFAAAAGALADAGLTLTRVTIEDAVAAVRRDHPDIVAIDADSVRDARALIGALSLITPAVVVALAHQAWPGSETARSLRAAGAGVVLPKPSGPASPTLAGADREAYRDWLARLAPATADVGT